MLAKKSAAEEWDYGYSPSSLSSSEVEYTFTFDCFACSFSLDHKEQLSFNASAKKSTSFKCSGNNDLASSINPLYSDISANSTSIESNLLSSLNSLPLS